MASFFFFRDGIIDFQILQKNTLLLLIFAGFAPKNREIKDPRKRIFDIFNVFLTFFKNVFLAKSRKLSPAKYVRSIFAKLISRENKEQ